MRNFWRSLVTVLLLVLLRVDHVTESREYIHRRTTRRRGWVLRRQSPMYPSDPADESGDRRDSGAEFDATPLPLQFPHHPTAAAQEFLEQCQSDCRLTVTNIKEVRERFEDLTEDLAWAPAARLVHFSLNFIDYSLPLMETYPYMENTWRGTEWVWASSAYGKRLLGLPTDADVLSLYILDRRWTEIQLDLASVPDRCFVLHSPECRLHEIRKLLIENVTAPRRNHDTLRQRREYVCHYVINNTEGLDESRLMHRCCESGEFRAGDVTCTSYVRHGDALHVITYVINVIALVLTLCSPIVLLRIKMLLKFDSVTKFFRASLKHGITGQRNYVIRISSRQLIDLSDRRPFSLPRALYRLVFHCYGEGRCCIHWWSEWSDQPFMCRKASRCRQCWFVAWKILAVLLVYPVILHVAVLLYAPKLPFYFSLVNYTQASQQLNRIALSVNHIASSLIPAHSLADSLWSLFSFSSFVYSATLLSWSNNPLERCLLRLEGKRVRDQPSIFHRRLLISYKGVLEKLAYGEFKTKRHFFRVPCFPWGLLRILKLTGRVLMQIPVVNVCFTTFLYDVKLFGGDADNMDDDDDDKDEAVDRLTAPVNLTIRTVCNKCLAVVLWFCFILLLLGYCMAVFIMLVFSLNVLFFVCLGTLLNASVFLPRISFVLVLAFYTNDILSTINSEHCFILKLIDENSPRISATEETEEEAYRDGGGGIQILKAHNLGAVKFIDGDNTEYVSKELYYNVCADLKQGWTTVTRRVLKRISFIFLYTLFLFTALQALSSFTAGSELLLGFVALLGSTLPKLLELYRQATDRRVDPRAVWTKLIPDILDRHIRVDRTRCIDEAEEALSTYDVRPIGVMDMDMPRVSIVRSLQLWKFPWTVSCDQQTQSTEGFVVALANKLAAASLLTRVITRGYSMDLTDDAVIRQWCQLVENCILESSVAAAAVGISTSVDSISLFPREYLSLVSVFDAGSTIDSAVDEINRQLYGPFTRGVLVTIGNTSCTILRATPDHRIMAFNAGCHGDQVTDIFGAVVIVTDFNTQNIQTILKYLIDPNRPDAVPVYSIVPVECFVFRTPEIFELESTI